MSCLLSIMADKENSFHYYIYTFCLGLATVVDPCKAKLTRSRQCTLLVLIDFCPVLSELFTWSSVTKTFAILPANIIEYQI